MIPADDARTGPPAPPALILGLDLSPPPAARPPITDGDEFAALHDDIIRASGLPPGHWCDPPPAWFDSRAADIFRQRLLQQVTRHSGVDRVPVIVLPAATPVLALWRQALADFDCRVIHLLPLSDPNDQPPSAALPMWQQRLHWLRAALAAERQTRDRERQLVLSDALPDWPTRATDAATRLGLPAEGSCLATHAVMQFRYNQPRRPLGFKRWGVYRHHVRRRGHPLVRHVNTVFDVPHSRFNDISREQFHAAGLHVLVESDQAGVHLATSADLFRLVFFQGHPEYDTISLLKEYKREVLRYATDQRDDFPPFPDHYLRERERALMLEYRERVDAALNQGGGMPAFPEDAISGRLDNTWHDTAEAVVGNWIGSVFQVTNHRRKLQFMDGIDPNDPLGLLPA